MSKIRFGAAATLALSILTAGGAAHADVFTDDLSRCLVNSSSAQDKKDLMIWVFAAMSRHPALQGYSTISATQRAEISKRAGLLFSRLLTVDCRKESVAVLKNSGQAGFQQAGSVLGATAMQSLTGDPNVAGAMGEMANYMDLNALQAMATEAGVK